MLDMAVRYQPTSDEAAVARFGVESLCSLGEAPTGTLGDPDFSQFAWIWIHLRTAVS